MIWFIFRAVNIHFLCVFSVTLSAQSFQSANRSVAVNRVRIIGGSRVNINNYPYQLSMQYKGRHICGASILSVRFALTAAHCTDKLSPIEMSLRAGSSARQQGGKVVQVKTVHQHPKFNIDTVDYDISVLEVTPKFTFSNTVRNIAIASSTPVQGSTVTVSGWGTTREILGRPSRTLQAVDIPIVSKSKCQKAYERKADITDRMLCAGVLNRGGKDSCQGDSGGPLVFNGKQVGIVSWGYGCGRSKYPGVYTNLNNKEVRNFVKRITGI